MDICVLDFKKWLEGAGINTAKFRSTVLDMDSLPDQDPMYWLDYNYGLPVTTREIYIVLSKKWKDDVILARRKNIKIEFGFKVRKKPITMRVLATGEDITDCFQPITLEEKLNQDFERKTKELIDLIKSKKALKEIEEVFKGGWDDKKRKIKNS